MWTDPLTQRQLEHYGIQDEYAFISIRELWMLHEQLKKDYRTLAVQEYEDSFVFRQVLADVVRMLAQWMERPERAERVSTSMHITPHVLKHADKDMQANIRQHMLQRLALELIPRLVDGKPHLVQLIRDEEIPPGKFYEATEKVLEVLVK